MYLSDSEQFYKRNIDERIEREGVLMVEYEISDGNRCNIYNNNHQAILMLLTIEQAYWVVNGILNFWDRIEGR